MDETFDSALELIDISACAASFFGPSTSLQKSDYVGSLVTGGETGRVTEYDGIKVQPPGWRDGFWKRHEANTGDNREKAIAKLRKLLGEDFRAKPVCELYLRDVLKG